MFRRFAPILTALTLAAALPVAGHAAAPTRSTATANHSTCILSFIYGRQSCYRPAAAAQALHQVPWARNPASAVALTFGLPLRQVSVLRQRAPGTASVAVVTELDHFYGVPTADYRHLGETRSIALRVIQYRTPANTRRFQSHWTHQICGTVAEISPAVDPNNRPADHGPWYLIANTRNGRHSIGLVGNTSVLMLEALACRLLA